MARALTKKRMYFKILGSCSNRFGEHTRLACHFRRPRRTLSRLGNACWRLRYAIANFYFDSFFTTDIEDHEVHPIVASAVSAEFGKAVATATEAGVETFFLKMGAIRESRIASRCWRWCPRHRELCVRFVLGTSVRVRVVAMTSVLYVSHV
jgi:hypothetical protein